MTSPWNLSSLFDRKASPSPEGGESEAEVFAHRLARAMAEGLSAALEAHATRTAEVLQVALDRHAEQVRKALDDQATTLQKTLGEATRAIAAASDRLEGAASGFATNVHELQALGDGLANLTGQASGVLAPFMERLDRLSWTLDTQGERLGQLTSMGGKVSQRMEEGLAGLDRALGTFGALVHDLGPSVTASLDASAQALGEAREIMAQRLSSLADDVREQVTLVREGVDSWTRLQAELAESQAELLSVGNTRLESMNRTVGTLAEAVNRLGPVGPVLEQTGDMLPALRRLLEAAVASHAALAEQIEMGRRTAVRLGTSAETLTAAIDGGLAEPLLVLEGSIREAIAPLIRLVDQATDNAERLERMWEPLMARLAPDPPF